MAKLNRDNQKGFTIVELVVVIIILGILAATALPRFIDVQDDAQLSVAEGVRGSFVSAVALTKAKYLASGKASTTIDLDGDGTNDVIVNGSGHPSDNASAIADTAQCQGLWNGILGAGAPATIIGAVAAVGAASLATGDAAWASGTEWYPVDDNATMANCTYSYLPEGNVAGQYAAYFTYTLDTGVVSALTVTVVP